MAKSIVGKQLQPLANFICVILCPSIQELKCLIANCLLFLLQWKQWMLYDFEPLNVCSLELFLQVKYGDKSLIFLYLQVCLQISSQWNRSGEL